MGVQDEASWLVSELDTINAFRLDLMSIVSRNSVLSERLKITSRVRCSPAPLVGH